jgi:prevent-host-death family protein
LTFLPLITIIILIDVVIEVGMIHKATAMNVRQNLGELLNEVQYKHDSILITKAGKPVAALVDVALFEKIRLMKVQFEALSTELAQAYKGVKLKTIEDEIVDAIRHARNQD